MTSIMLEPFTAAGVWVPIESAIGLHPGAFNWALTNGYSHVGTNCVRFVNKLFMQYIHALQGADLEAFFRRQESIPYTAPMSVATSLRWGMDFPFSRSGKRPAEFEEPERVVRPRVGPDQVPQPLTVVAQHRSYSLMNHFWGGMYGTGFSS